MIEGAELIRLLGLKPHPEGGYYRETYRASGIIPASALPPRFKKDRTFATAILYLLPAGSKSRLHRLFSDETWHFYAGGPLTIFEIEPEGRVSRTILGNDPGSGQRFQHTVKAGIWFGALPCEGAPHSLVGCTVSPGFDFADFEVGRRKDLLAMFPRERHTIEMLADES